MLKNEFDVVQIMENFFAYIHTQFHCVVECMRSNNAKELCEGEML